MSAPERWVLLGVARPRAEWFRRVGQWTASATIPAEFLKCLSVADLCARVDSTRAFSAALLDGHSPEVDRDLVAWLTEAGVPAVVVDENAHRWRDLPAATVLDPAFDRETLIDVLQGHARRVAHARQPDPHDDQDDVSTPHGHLVAVTGPGGTGASTAAIALAQGLADRRQVLLADLCRVADQAMLHDSGVVVPAIQELVEAHRTGRPTAADVRRQTFGIAERGYRLLLGLRHPSQWVALRPRALEATIETLQRCFDLVVADVDPELEGAAETGSVDVEERHSATRAAMSRATAVVVVGAAGMKGTHALGRTIRDVLDFGVPARRVVPVVTLARRSPRARAELASTLQAVLEFTLGGSTPALASPVFLPKRRVGTALRDGVALPRPLPSVMAGAVRHMLDEHSRRHIWAAPVPVEPGSLGVTESSP